MTVLARLMLDRNSRKTAEHQKQHSHFLRFWGVCNVQNRHKSGLLVKCARVFRWQNACISPPSETYLRRLGKLGGGQTVRVPPPAGLHMSTASFYYQSRKKSLDLVRHETNHCCRAQHCTCTLQSCTAPSTIVCIGCSCFVSIE